MPVLPTAPTEPPLASATARFDLGEEAAYVARAAYYDRLTLALVAVGFRAFGAAVALLTPGSWPVLLPCGLFAGLFAWFGVRARRPPPFDGLELDGVGVRFHFVDGSEVRMAWGDPAFGITVTDRSTDPMVSSEGRSHLMVRLPHDRGGTISKRLLLTLQDTALAHGVAVHTGPETARQGRRRVTRTVTRIGDPTPTPGPAAGPG